MIKRVVRRRRYLFEQIAGVFAEAGKSLPLYVDKHLSHCAVDALWMMERAEALSIPLMCGSSLPVCWRKPNLEYSLGEQHMEEVCCLVNGGVVRCIVAS